MRISMVQHFYYVTYKTPRKDSDKQEYSEQEICVSNLGWSSRNRRKGASHSCKKESFQFHSFIFEAVS